MNYLQYEESLHRKYVLFMIIKVYITQRFESSMEMAASFWVRLAG